VPSLVWIKNIKMIISYIITILQAIIWVLPIFRQWKSPDFKQFFFIMGIQDIVVICSILLFKIGAYQHYVVWATILLLSFLPFFNTGKRIALLIFICLPFIAVTKYLPDKTANTIILLQYSFVFLILMRKFVTYFNKNHIILLFHLALIFYIFSNVLKLFLMLGDVKTGLAYFMTTTFIQIFFAIYFMIDSDYKPKIIIYNGNIEKNTASELN